MKKIVFIAAAAVLGAALGVALVFALWPEPEVRTCTEWAPSPELEMACVFADAEDEEMTRDEFEDTVKDATDSLNEFLEEWT